MKRTSVFVLLPTLRLRPSEPCSQRRFYHLFASRCHVVTSQKRHGSERAHCTPSLIPRQHKIPFTSLWPGFTQSSPELHLAYRRIYAGNLGAASQIQLAVRVMERLKIHPDLDPLEIVLIDMGRGVVVIPLLLRLLRLVFCIRVHLREVKHKFIAESEGG